eukprot:1158244-Pelagomonas_calceolata.AAC.11
MSRCSQTACARSHKQAAKQKRRSICVVCVQAVLRGANELNGAVAVEDERGRVVQLERMDRQWLWRMSAAGWCSWRGWIDRCGYSSWRGHGSVWLGRAGRQS